MTFKGKKKKERGNSLYAEIPITQLARKDSEEHLPAGYSACEGVGGLGLHPGFSHHSSFTTKEGDWFLLFLSYFSYGWVCSLNS